MKTAGNSDVKVELGGTLNAGGNINVFGIVKDAFKQEDQSDKGEEEKALYELVKKLPPRSARQYRPPSAELEKMVARLREKRLILISCSFAEYALDAAWAVIDRLPGSASRFKGMIAFEDTVGKDIEFSFQRLFEQRPEVAGESVVLVDALNTLAQNFPNSILGHSARAESIKTILEDKQHFLVVLVDLSYARQNQLAQLANLARQNFPYWEIPFLGPFLEREFPAQHESLLEAIADQRRRGLWEMDESRFAQQVTTYFSSNRLIEVVESGGPKDPESSAEAMLKAINPVEKTVLYAATFFQEITSPEFCRVVEALLNKRTVRGPAPAGSNGAGNAEVEIPLRRTWEEEKDDIFTKLLIETTGANDSPRTINLCESNLREPLRKLFEKKYRFYLMDQFKALQETGIFFYPSLRLAENTTQIAFDMARIYPDEFNEGWIVSLVIRLRQHFGVEEAKEPEESDSMFEFLPSSLPGASNVAFARISDICHRLLESPQQKKTVNNSLDYLMKTGYHEEVLWLIKQLKFSAEFDDWHWLKQLLHQADRETRILTYYYLISYLKRMGPGVYDGLTKMELWLPPVERQTYSPANIVVFRLLIKYCLDTIDRFDPKYYGKWPSRYPLFAIDANTAEAHMSLLARWLLHPGIDPTLRGLGIGGNRMILIGALLAEWSFILLGTPAAREADPSDSQNQTQVSQASEGPVNEWSAEHLFELLLRQFTSRIDLTQRLDLLKFWNQLDHDLFRFRSSSSKNPELCEELTWKRNLVRRLIAEIKHAPRSKKPLLTEARPVASV